jgi:hypothetical protein
LLSASLRAYQADSEELLIIVGGVSEHRDALQRKWKDVGILPEDFLNLRLQKPPLIDTRDANGLYPFSVQGGEYVEIVQNILRKFLLLAVEQI